MSIEKQVNAEPKLLISESLQDVLPEDDLAQIDEMFISAAVVIDAKSPMLVGNLIGIEFGEFVKIDVKVPIRMAFEFVSMLLKEKKNAQFAALMLADETSKVPGPFSISNIKIVEVDPSNKLCVVAIDLARVSI